jgi:thiamine transport system permease protein
VRLLPVSAVDAVVNSLLFGVAAAGIALIIGGTASLAIVHGSRLSGRLLDLGMLLPLGTSAVTLGFGVLISLDRGVLDLRGSWWIVPITQSLIAIPFVIRSVVPVLRAIDPRMREAAATLGAAPRTVRREIDLRIGARALATGVGFAFAVSLGEFGATSFVGRRPDLLTVPLAIQRLLSTPGDALRGQAMALSVILMVITAMVVFVGDRLHPGSGGVL